MLMTRCRVRCADNGRVNDDKSDNYNVIFDRRDARTSG